MSDQALAWKAGFGALLLLFSAASFLARKHPYVTQHAAPAPVAAKLVAPAPPVPEPLRLEQAAPLDVREDAPPIRVEVTLHDRENAFAAPAHAGAKLPRPLQRVTPPAPSDRTSKFVPRHVKQVVAKRDRSPYQPGRKHYPYDRKERLALRDMP
jgi:hypothetical protein